MKQNDYFCLLHTFLVAVTITDGVLINLLSAQINPVLADNVGRFLLYSTTIISLVRILNSRQNYKSFVLSGITILAMYYYQKNIVTTSSSDLLQDFIVHGIGGLIIGYSVKDFAKLVKYVGIISLVYCIILIGEAYNHSLLALGNMSTGYLLAPLAIWLLLNYYLGKGRIFLYVAIPQILLITLFSSRGCGLSIFVAWVIFITYRNYYKGNNSGKILRNYCVFGLAAYFLFMISENFIIANHLVGDDSSFIGRVIYGGANKSSGRDLIWLEAVRIISENPLTGIGMGMDRDYLGYLSTGGYVHNLILEVLMNFGIIFGTIVLTLYMIPIIKLLKNSKDIVVVMTIWSLIAMYIVRLFVSGSYLNSSFELLILLGIALSNKKTENVK